MRSLGGKNVLGVEFKSTDEFDGLNGHKKDEIGVAAGVISGPSHIKEY